MECESSVVIQSGENKMNTEKEIKEESLGLEKEYSKVEYEPQEPVLQNEENSSDFALESSSSTVTFNSYDGAYNNTEIKEEHWWEETESVEVKPESEEFAFPETELPIEPKACIARRYAEENAALENIANFSRRNTQKLFKLNRNKPLLHKRGKYRQVGVDCECELHCFDRINDIERNRIMEHFQNLSNADLQNAYLFDCLKLDELNQKEEDTYLHSSSFQYFVQTIEGEKVEVCKKAFLSIHGLQNNTNLQNAAHIGNPRLLFKKRKPFLKVSSPLTWKKKRVLAMLLLHKLQLQLQLGGM